MIAAPDEPFPPLCPSADLLRDDHCAWLIRSNPGGLGWSIASALLINPFYPKDPHASFGKHVLTPTLALTSFAATTPELAVHYWDENLLHGRPPGEPMPSRWSESPCI